MTTDQKIDSSLEVGVALGRLFAAAEDAESALRDHYGSKERRAATRLRRAILAVQETMGLDDDAADEALDKTPEETPS